VQYFLSNDLPFLRDFKVPVVASVAGESIEEYQEVVGALDGARGLSGIELNVSCPNIKRGGVQFGSDRALLRRVVSGTRKRTRLPLIVKLSPNVTDIGEMAEIAVDSGADALSLINSLNGMSVDVKARMPKLANVTGGLTGPAIRPVAVYMVWQAAKRVGVPIIGMGGITAAEDALEFFLAGASAVAVGTANFINPRTAIDIADGLAGFLEEHGYKSIKGLVGRLKV
jgi:dihydroorotate dehydrogenase (NAD+) catalytic subunit